MRRDSYRIAIGGLLTAAAVALLFLGSVLPFATFAVPAAASLCVLFFALEYNKGFAFLVFLAIALLAVFLVPDKEMAFLFLFIFGHYPILKGIFEQFRSKAVSWAAKFAALNICVLLLYWILRNILRLDALVLEFSGYAAPMLFLLLFAGNVVFLVYDIALTRLITLYLFRIRPKLTRTPPPERRP